MAHIHLILIVCSLAVHFPANFTISYKRDCLVLASTLSQTILCLASITHKGSCSDLKNPSSSVRCGLFQQFNSTEIYGVPAMWWDSVKSYLPGHVLLWNEFARQGSLVSEQGV